MDWALVFYLLSERFGWTPGEIKRLNLEQISDYMRTMVRVEKTRQKKMPKMPRAPAMPRVGRHYG